MVAKKPKHTYCEGEACNVDVMNPLFSSIISYCITTAVLAKPLFNAAGADTKNIMSIFGLNGISLTAIGLFFAIIFSGYISAFERHKNPLLCAVHACGIPGILLAFFAVVVP